jgi:CO/xanthine dehydrogenase Mo-binding subunit
MGLSMALMRKPSSISGTGRTVNANLAEHHVPANADIGLIDVDVVEEISGARPPSPMPSTTQPGFACANRRLRSTSCSSD